MGDLIVLVADKDMEHAVKGLLSRNHSLGIRNVTYNIVVDREQHDPGCFLRGHQLLRLYQSQYSHGLVMFDRVGCGAEGKTREQLEQEVEDRLSQSGWEDRAAAVVPDPELEIWVWSNSPHVDTTLGWHDKVPSLRSWMVERGHSTNQGDKPAQPKEVFETALRLATKARSSSIYQKLAETVSLNHCADPAFEKLKKLLREWFAV